MNKGSGSTRHSRGVTAIAIVAGITAASIASASWSAQSNGNAKAQAGRLAAVTASPAAPTTELFPGGSADAALTLTNPNPVAMTVSSIVGDGTIVSDSAACNDAGHGVTFTDQAGAWEVAKSATLNVGLPNAVHMSVDSADACQGATFTIPVVVVSSVSGQGGDGAPITTTTSTTMAPANLSWQPPNYTFPSSEVGTQQSATVSLRNTGGTPAQVEQGAMGNADFTVQSTTCTNTLGANASCTYTIRFATTSPGQKGATFAVRIQGTPAWTTLTVSGTALAPASLVVEPSSWNYGNVAVGTTSAPKTFTVRNIGQSPAQNVFTEIVGPQASSFVWAGGTCSSTSTLPAGGTCTVGVSFRSTSAGANSATLRAGYNNGSSALAQLSATGV